MTKNSTPTDHVPDSSDVVDGPIGSAWLKDPAISGPIGADLEALPPIDVDSDDIATVGGSIEGGLERPERGLVGAD